MKRGCLLKVKYWCAIKWMFRTNKCTACWNKWIALCAFRMSVNRAVQKEKKKKKTTVMFKKMFCCWTAQPVTRSKNSASEVLLVARTCSAYVTCKGKRSAGPVQISWVVSSCTKTNSFVSLLSFVIKRYHFLVLLFGVSACYFAESLD